MHQIIDIKFKVQQMPATDEANCCKGCIGDTSTALCHALPRCVVDDGESMKDIIFVAVDKTPKD